MATRGYVYKPKAQLPPDALTNHSCVVLSNLPSGYPNELYVMVAIVRSEKDQSGKPVSKVMGHTFPLAKADYPWLRHDSLLETHQLFALPLREFQGLTPVGALQQDDLDDALGGARRLFL